MELVAFWYVRKGIKCPSKGMLIYFHVRLRCCLGQTSCVLEYLLYIRQVKLIVPFLPCWPTSLVGCQAIESQGGNGNGIQF